MTPARAVILLSLLSCACAIIAAEQPIAPGKFIPVFATKYGGSTGWPDLRDAAKFDVILSGTGAARPKADPEMPGNTWQILKRLNPNLVLLLYRIGPAEYNTADWGRLGKGWEWIVSEHGSGPDRWIARGARFNQPLQARPYPKERMMLPGNATWQQYWLDNVYAAHWADSTKPTSIADGLFSDNTRFSLIWKNEWRREGAPDVADDPSEYYHDGKFDEARYHRDMSNCFARIFPWMKAKGLKLGLNFGDMVREPNTWAELDEFPSAPFAAMEEGAFVHPWGNKNTNFVFRPEKDWLTQVEVMRKLKHVRALMNVHGPVMSEFNDARRMDARDGLGRRAWDVLWYSMMSFLQGYDDQRQNACMSFTIWSYLHFYWLPEFDPTVLHLGAARGDYRRVEGRAGHVYMREFEDGWAVVNPANSPATGVAVPAGEARVIDHDSLSRPETSPLVQSFDLPSQRGIVLLKKDRKIGNADNLSQH